MRPSEGISRASPMGRGADGGSGRRGVKRTLDDAPHAAVHADLKPKSKQEKKAERYHHRYHEMKIGKWSCDDSVSR